MKKRKKTQWLSEEALQIAQKIREAKGKGEKEIYPFECKVLKNSKERQESLPQCKEIEENNSMGKTRDLFKKNQRYQGNMSCKDGHNNGQK